MRYIRLAAVATAALTLACSGSDTAGLAPSSDPLSLTPGGPSVLNGLWTRLGEVPGSSERLDLVVTDTIVKGSGSWTGEACCQGGITVSGVITAGQVHLTVKFFNQAIPGDIAPRFVETVDAPVPSGADLVGSSTVNGYTVTAHWRKGVGII